MVEEMLEHRPIAMAGPIAVFEASSATARKCLAMLRIFMKLLRKITTRLSWLYGRGSTG